MSGLEVAVLIGIVFVGWVAVMLGGVIFGKEQRERRKSRRAVLKELADFNERMHREAKR